MDRERIFEGDAVGPRFAGRLRVAAALLMGCGPVAKSPASDGAGTTTGGPDPVPVDVGCGIGCKEDLPPPPIEPIACGNAPICDKGAWVGDFMVTDEANMDEIAGYTSVSGEVRVEATGATCLRFLSCLTFAGGLVIESNPHLENVDGLESLASTSGFDVVVANNPALTNLSGFSGLQTVSEGDLLIFKNDALTTLNAFGSLTEVSGTLGVSENANLIEIAGFGALQKLSAYANPMPPPGEFGGSFLVSEDPSLERITGFVALEIIERNFAIQRNDVLTDLSGLRAIRVILGGFHVTNNPALCSSEVDAIVANLEEGPSGPSPLPPYKDC